MIAVTAFFSILIGTLVVVFAIKYRRRPDHEVATEIHESGTLEIAWTILPFGIVLVMFFWGAAVWFRITRPPANAIEVYVTAKQWMWKIQHADGHREMNELHVPVGQPVRLTMASEDVIHSFFVPAFRFKRDVVPGRFATAWFEATKPGKYHLFCAEYCGTRHSGMIGWIYAMTPADYQAWLSGGTAGESLASAGARRFVEQACNTCHGEVKGARGPSLDRHLRQARAHADRRRSSSTRPTCASRSPTRRRGWWRAIRPSCRPTRASSARRVSCS